MTSGSVSFRTGMLWVGIIAVVIAAGLAAMAFVAKTPEKAAKPIIFVVIGIIVLIGFSIIYPN